MIYVLEATLDRKPIYKVGFTRESVEKRLLQIQPNCPVPLKVVQVFEGDLEDEKRLHGYLSCLRIHNEWFKHGPLIMDVIYSRKGGKILYGNKRECLSRFNYQHLFLSRGRKTI